MRYIVAFFICILLVACSAQPAGNPPSGWHFNKKVGEYDFSDRVKGIIQRPPGRISMPSHWHILYLTKQEDASWRASQVGDASTPSTEAIYLDPDTQTIGLAASGTSLQTNGQAASVCTKVIDYDRKRSGYLACNSELVSTVKDLGVIFIPLKPLMKLTGDDITAFELDQTVLAEALEKVNIDLVASELSAQYEHQQIAAKKAMLGQKAEREAQTAYFRAHATVGTKTLCGIVIAEIGSLVEIQLLGNKQRVVAERDKLEMPRAIHGAEHIHHCARTFL